MNVRTRVGRVGIALLVCASTFAMPGVSFADGHGGGFHGGGGGGFHGGGGHAGPAFHGSPPVHAAYVHGGGHYYGGHYGHYYGGRPYWGGRGYYGYRGWYGGLALGAFVATLPLYYSTYWWGGVPYYYYDDTYYRYDRDVGQYEVVAPPPEAATSTQAPANTSQSVDLYAYPKNGQNEEQQKNDRYECHRWAAGQTGFDPTEGTTNQSGPKSGDYRRAETACLNARGYSVQ